MDKAEYEEWKHHPLTKQFHQFLLDYRKKLMEDWAEGSFSNPDLTAGALRNSEAVARCQVYKDLVELDAGYISEFYSKGTANEQYHHARQEVSTD
jgi:hypothetical protein